MRGRRERKRERGERGREQREREGRKRDGEKKGIVRYVLAPIDGCTFRPPASDRGKANVATCLSDGDSNSNNSVLYCARYVGLQLKHVCPSVRPAGCLAAALAIPDGMEASKKERRRSCAQ